MTKRISSVVLTVLLIATIGPHGVARDDSGQTLKQQERYTLSLDLAFSKRNPNAVQKLFTFLDWGPNGYASGFLVGDGLVMTAYHVVSGELDSYKKVALGFAATDQLDVRIFINGMQARVLKVDKEADLALLSIGGGSKRNKKPAFQSLLNKDEKLLLIARPHGDNILRQGTFFGSTTFNGLEYWSVKMNARDGFSGSPVYNEKAELVGVMSGYDRTKKLALLSPGMRAQKLLEEYFSTRKK